ncbi:MAG: hypothetical protein ACFFAS_19805 [Promethearchaeota archaeon]
MKTLIDSFINCLKDLMGEIFITDIVKILLIELDYVWERKINTYYNNIPNFEQNFKKEIYSWLIYLNEIQKLPKDILYTRYTGKLVKIDNSLK